MEGHVTADKFPGLLEAVRAMNFTAYYDFLDELGSAFGESVHDRILRWDCRIEEIRMRLELERGPCFEKPVNLVAPSKFPGLLEAVEKMNRTQYVAFLRELEETYHRSRLAQIQAKAELESQLMDPRLLEIAGSDEKH